MLAYGNVRDLPSRKRSLVTGCMGSTEALGYVYAGRYPAAQPPRISQKAEMAQIQKPAQNSHSQRIISLERTGTVAGVAQA